MDVELYLISANEEYANRHMCRGHWNYKWRGRKGSSPGRLNKIKMRKEKFGGLLQTMDGKIYKVDHEGFEVIKRFYEKQSKSQISKEMDIDKTELNEFIRELKKLNIPYDD